MIERDQRLVLLAENQAGAAPWYQLAYERLTQETPFSFKRPAQLTDAGRAGGELPREPRAGGRAAVPAQPLDQHRPRAASRQRRDRQRVRAAAASAPAPVQRLRGRRVNLLAVDFYKRGDLFRVVDALNGT